MKKIYLSPSTQQWNIGASKYGNEEVRCNLVVDVIENNLKSYNDEIKVYRNKPSMSIYQIVNDSNKKDVDIHFAVHTNAYNKKVKGCEVFCHKFGGEGEKFSRIIYDKISKITPWKDRGVKEGYIFYNGKPMYETCYTTASASLAEIDFHDNPDSSEWIIKNIELIGDKLTDGILEYFKVPPKPSDISGYLYKVQCGAFKSLDNAKLLEAQLFKKGFGVYIKKEKI